ncbi:MAG: SAM-dependent DNA methyltransferase, partial [Candidatus Hydrothermarchaeota archaeon]
MKPWLTKRHLKLLEQFKNSQFSREEVISLLKETFNDDINTVDVVLSELKKEGLLEVIPDKSDKRKRGYKLIEPEVKHKKITRSDLEALLKRAADLIRTRVDYKFILILLFLKRISDKWEEEYERIYREALEAGLGEEEARREAESWEYDFKIPREYLWEEIRKDVNTLSEKLA